jgi:hypothetical protein
MEILLRALMERNDALEQCIRHLESIFTSSGGPRFIKMEGPN